MATPKFKQVSGLTSYAFACGYLQVAKLQWGDAETVVKLAHSGGNCYHVTAHAHPRIGGNFTGTVGMLHYTATESLGHARKVWLDQVNSLFAVQLAAVKRDKRFRMVREFCGEREQMWGARFCGEWVGKSDTKVGAQLLAYTHTHGYRA